MLGISKNMHLNIHLWAKYAKYAKKFFIKIVDSWTLWISKLKAFPTAVCWSIFMPLVIVLNRTLIKSKNLFIQTQLWTQKFDLERQYCNLLQSMSCVQRRLIE